jgi:hypothetical protein
MEREHWNLAAAQRQQIDPGPPLGPGSVLQQRAGLKTKHRGNQFSETNLAFRGLPYRLRSGGTCPPRNTAGETPRERTASDSGAFPCAVILAVWLDPQRSPLIAGVNADNYFLPVTATREDEAREHVVRHTSCEPNVIILQHR